MIHIGFTGTQNGMTPIQCQHVYHIILSTMGDFIAHHGDCTGADAQFDSIVKCFGRCRGIVYHIPDNDSKRAFCMKNVPPHLSDVRQPKPYLERNKDIVNECLFLIATPKEEAMQVRSGTWSTYRYAAEQKKPRHLVLPNGGVVSDA